MQKAAGNDSEKKKLVRMIILVLIISQLFALACKIKAQLSPIISKENVLIRPQFGEGSRELLLMVEGEQEKESLLAEIDFVLNEQKPSEEELSGYFDYAVQYLENTILGANKSLDCITEDLVFVKKIPKTGMTVTWSLDDYSYISADGNVSEKRWLTEPKIIEASAVISYEEEEVIHTFLLRLLPQEQTREEQLKEEARKQLIMADMEGEGRELVLPGEAGGYKLSWRAEEDKTPLYLSGLGIIAALLLPVIFKQEEVRKKRLKEAQMHRDYPYIVDKLLHLLTAGMTIRSAIERISSDYKKKGDKRAAYEELLITRHELMAGISEKAVLEGFGRRCGLLPYIRLSTLLIQNLKKGARGILPLLELEAKSAVEERKQTAKRLGEEAGTKLLFPMAGYLLIVMLIIMVPTLMQMK